jgi:hypothetical protein
MNKLPFTIAVDFDNTIAHSIWPDIKGLMPNAKEGVNDLFNSGCKIIIWTCRENKAAEEAKQFLDENGILYHHFNENCPERTALFDSDSRKIGADLYVDDKGTEGIVPWHRVTQKAKCLKLLQEEGFGIGHIVKVNDKRPFIGMIVGVQFLFFIGTKQTAYIKVRNDDGVQVTVPLSSIEHVGD